jgi:hypothetical protein
MDQVIGYRTFVDGAIRAIYKNAQGQYVLDDDGKRIYGTFIPEDESCELPLIVESNPESA